MPSPIAFPPGPSWVLVNADQPLSLPVLGQFDPELRVQKGRPKWQSKDGIAGGMPWLKYTGKGLGYFTFVFHAISLTTFDQYPLLAWERINELADYDSTFGRPPRVWWWHGLHFFEGFIVDIPDAPIKHWGPGIINSRLVREIGPVTITVKRIPKEKTELSISTNYVTKTDDTLYEELALQQYGDARYGHTLEEHNQGVQVEETIELPRKNSGLISKTT